MQHGNRSWSLYILVGISLSCAGEVGEQGQQGPPGAGWSERGNDIHTSKSGNVGIGTDQPKAKLDVRGGLWVEEDATLLPSQTCRDIVLDDPTKGDLGDQLNPLLKKYRCVSVLLKKGTTWQWNKTVALLPGQRVDMTGENSWPGGAEMSGVFLRLTTNDSRIADGIEQRRVARVVVGEDAKFSLFGVSIVDVNVDMRPLSVEGPMRALFTTSGHGALVFMSRCRITTSEDVVGVGSGGGLATVQLHVVNIDRAPGLTTDVQAVKMDWGLNTGPGFGLIAHARAELGTGVLMKTAPGLMFNPPLL